MQNKKQAIILSIVASLALLVLIVGATYAYFQASGGTGTSANLKVTTYTTDVFNFEVGNDISIYADATSFASGKGNASGSTFAKAILTANNKTNTATEHYYLYLNISNNTFLYTQNESTPELLLTITDASGNAVTDITSLAYKTVTDGKGTSISGYDITNKSGLITLFNNKEITASPTKTDEWNITVTLVNYDKDQSENAGKSFSAKLMIQKEEYKLPTLAEYVKSQYTGTQGDNGIYYHDSTLTNGAGDNSYRFAGASDAVNNYICLGSNEATCPDANLFRIIGVFGDRVKLIKSTSVGKMKWDSNGSNTWSTSSLNIYLNNDFLNAFDETTKGKIADTTWKVGGFSSSGQTAQTAQTVYQNEIVSPVTTNATDNATTYSAKVGLMYVSDYGFAAAPSAWTANFNTYNGDAIKNVNWMYMGLMEWTISRYADYSNRAFSVANTGYVSDYRVGNYAFGARPVFNLTSSVNYASGSGSATDPILVN
ncbi:unknown [Firmicutes bacterium CAG:460]|nr:unknown [Firmicutes bacterium CAG:460]